MDIKSGKIDQDILHIGNALNTLGAEGLATAPVVSDMASRIGSVGISLGLTSGQVLGLSATMQELNIESEKGSTAVVAVLQRMLTSSKDFAKVAGMNVTEFKKLCDTDLYAAFMKVVDGAGKSKDSATGFAKLLDKLKLDGSGTSQVIAGLSSNQTLLHDRVTSATEALKGQDSILSEFDLKNNNRAANLEKLSKKFNGLFSSASFNDLSDLFMGWADKGIDVLKLVMSVFGSLIKLIIAGTAAFVAYNAVVVIATLTQAAWWKTLLESEAATKLIMVAEQAWAAIKLVLAGRITEARNAMAGFNAVMEANPIGLVIGAIAALVTMVILFKDTTNAMADAQNKLNEIHQKGIEGAADETEKINQLQEIIKDETAAREDKLLAIKKLRDIMPDHLKGYTDERILAGDAKIAVEEYIKTLEHRAAAEAAFEELKKLQTEKRRLENGKGNMSVADWIGVVAADIFTGQKNGQEHLENTEKSNKAKALSSVDAQIAAIKNEFRADFQKQALETPTSAVSHGTGNYTDEEDDKTKRKREQLMEESKRLSQQFKGFSAGELADLMATNEKEILDTGQKFDKMIQDEQNFLNNKKVKELLSDQELQKHRDEITALQKQKTDALNQIRLRQEKEYLQAVEKLRLEMSDRHESETQKEYDRINQFYDEELQKVGNNEAAKAKIQADRAHDLADAKLRAEKRLQQDTEGIKAQAPVAEANRDKVELARINKKYDDQVQALKDKYEKELGATQAYQDALALIQKNRKAETDTYKADKKKEQDKKNKDLAIQSAQDVSNAVFQIGANNRKAESDAYLANIEKKRDAELANKNLTEKQKQAINDKYDAQVKAEKLRAWQADKKAALEQAIINTALAVVKALPIWQNAAAAGVAGAAQIAIIAAQKPPQFATGVRNAPEGLATVGEAGPEIIQEGNRLRLADHEMLTYLQKGANVYNAGDTAKILSGNNTRSVALAAFQNMNATAAGVRFNQQGFTASVDAYRYGSTATTQPAAAPTPSATSQDMDWSAIMDKFDQMIQAQKDANDKQVKFIYQDFEKFKNKIDRARFEAGKTS
ncbi:hypothetical protein HH214_01505 [Mucilaginibacter robiniae]|uniref:Phage tail tape measure protein n=1 Tax=Mucilaginibacter robiniae TaxID=2728022 RepID=A0A7L5DWK7_9SPHI|nr:phage tail tape measure protein [Mucilaginibacter robiniae]QJD94638.1 hypothetical protein HH214_01505 [Mucilaginibacter robiniae]